MKPLSIADYLDHLGRAAGEKAPPRCESSPFRPRSLPGQPSGEPGARPTFERAGKAGGETQGDERSAPQRRGRQSRFRWLRGNRLPARSRPRPEDMSAKLAEAHARGREEGLAAGRAEALDRHAAELAALREQAETQRQEFHLSEYMEFEGAIRSGLRQIEDQCRRRGHPHSCAVSSQARSSSARRTS